MPGGRGVRPLGQDPDARVSRIGVLRSLGHGNSHERKHSELYAEAVQSALVDLGRPSSIIDSSPSKLGSSLADLGATSIFNCCYGAFGEDGRLAALLEAMGVPYTGCGPEAAALTLDKYYSGLLFQSAGFSVPKIVAFEHGRIWANYNQSWLVSLEASRRVVSLLKTERGVLKPRLGSFRQGIKEFSGVDELHAILESSVEPTAYIIQSYEEGSDAHVSVLSGKTLAVAESVAGNEALRSELDFCTKFRSYFIPGRFREATILSLGRQAEAVYRLFGCRGLVRVDFRVTSTGCTKLLEINSQHSVRPLSLASHAARFAGLSLHELVSRIADSALVPSIP